MMRKQRVLLVYPEIPTTYWSFKYMLPFIGKKAVPPPLGLVTVAAILAPAWECRLADMNVEPLDDAERVLSLQGVWQTYEAWPMTGRWALPK